MSATEILHQIEELPAQEQRELFVLLSQKMMGAQNNTNTKPWLGRKLSFDEACDLVFRENRQLLSALAR